MPSGKPKIIMVGPARGVKGGVSSVVNVLLGSALVERYDIHYISSHHDKGLVVKLWYAMRGFVVFAYKAVLYQIPVVHIHMASRASFFRKSIFVLFSKIINRKVVLHIHGAEFHLFYYIESGRVKRWFIRSVMRSAACVIVLSPEWRTRLGELFAKDQEVKVINNAISLPPAKEDYVSGNIVRVLFMGRIGERKGVFDLVLALKSLHTQIPCLVTIAGDGEIDRLRGLIHECGLNKVIGLPGWVVPATEYSQADIFVLPSYNEGLPMSVVEACGYGIPVISTNVGGIPRIVAEGVNGFLITPGDVDALKEKLTLLIENPYLREKMGRAGYQKVKDEFDINSVEKQYDAIYRKLLVSK